MAISEGKLHHIIGVARQCYKLSIEKYNTTEQFARSMFVYGWNHDIGYEFCKIYYEHQDIGADMIAEAMFKGENNDVTEVFRNHTTGKGSTLEDKILAEADLTVDTDGNIVTVEERLEDIKSRYGKESQSYQIPLHTAQEYKLLS